MAKSGKKGAQTALQTEVNTDEEWQEILARPGLVIVDVYSDWSGPCVAMVSTLRKIKLEIAGDLLTCAVARNDEISDLERFRGKSEPTWMFLQDGQMVNMMFGAHCPMFRKMLEEEIQRIRQNESPKWSLPVTQRGPEEEEKWQKEEAIRKETEERRAAVEEAERKAKYEDYLEQMMFELCEETALLLYPWVFLDEEGNPRDKDRSPPYMELKSELFLECFDIAEEVRIALDEETIEKMFVESDVEITNDLIAGLTAGKCMVMRLRGKPPHPDWPVRYPNECLKDTVRCPIRAYNDVENYLLNIITNEPPPLLSSNLFRRSFDQPFVERHLYIREEDAEAEGEEESQVYPAAWVPPQARSKVHVFKTVFGAYMARSHPYEEPAPPLPLCAFKFEMPAFAAMREAYANFAEAVKYFAAFEYDQPPFARRLAYSPEEFESKVKLPTEREIFVVIIEKVSEEAFLSFAGTEPYFVSEDQDEIAVMIQEYFEATEKIIVNDDAIPEEEDFQDEEESDEEEEEAEEAYEMDEEFEYGVIETY